VRVRTYKQCSARSQTTLSGGRCSSHHGVVTTREGKGVVRGMKACAGAAARQRNRPARARYVHVLASNAVGSGGAVNEARKVNVGKGASTNWQAQRVRGSGSGSGEAAKGAW